MRKTKSKAGFTLIELMIAIAIIGIIASIAMPSYRNYTMRANRTDGIAMMNHIMQAQERFFAENRTYTTDLTTLGFATIANIDSADGHYKVSAQACGADALNACVQLVATAQGQQVNDQNGNSGNLAINSRGQSLGYEH